MTLSSADGISQSTTVVANNQSVASTQGPEGAPGSEELAKATFGTVGEFQKNHPTDFNRFMHMWAFQVCVEAKRHNDHLVQAYKEQRRQG